MKINYLTSKYRLVNTRITLVLLFFIVSSGYILAQDQLITLTPNIPTLQKLFDEIEKQTQLTVSYNQTKLDVTQPVSLKADKKSVSQIMAEILKDTDFTFHIENAHIIITPPTKALQRLSTTSHCAE